ncbi:MAG: phosphate signaling complex protein PhoU [Candidatus Margulisbacteria bacterium]|jgi:phosphate transport system protein|nr:phosphate signaling complex protein PhoU [Candidatus Margulisiibacteriota bacterium]
MLAEKLTDLKKDLAEYAALIETMVRDGILGLINQDADKLQNVPDKYEPRANLKEIEIDEKCVALLAQHQPKAKDLRTVLMALGMNRDLERMGDHAVNIARNALCLLERPALKPPFDLPLMSEVAGSMLSDAISAFVREDPALGRNVCARDDQVDELRGRILHELIACMSADVSTIEGALHIIKVSDNLERIADLATNIGEEVIFMVEGRVLKHHLGE